MEGAFSGGCACGAIRYETVAEPMFQNHCQCRDCQKRSGTGHGSYLAFPARGAVRITGDARGWTSLGDSGFEKTHWFCPSCGTPVWLTVKVLPDAIVIHAGTLDDPGRFAPVAVTYGSRAQAWDRIDPGLRWFEAMPTG